MQLTHVKQKSRNFSHEKRHWKGIRLLNAGNSNFKTRSLCSTKTLSVIDNLKKACSENHI